MQGIIYESEIGFIIPVGGSRGAQRKTPVQRIRPLAGDSGVVDKLGFRATSPLQGCWSADLWVPRLRRAVPRVGGGVLEQAAALLRSWVTSA